MCGIAGIINKTPRSFDYSTFCTLGISNDERGGDSCGIFIDGKYEYGVGDNRFFANFFQNNKLLEGTTTSTIALVHCRKASIGVISKETAQPVVITNDKGKVDFVLMHNGTIYNYEELAAKYIPNVDIKGMTDSQVMARIFYYAGYDVLDEYNGGGVFAMVDYRGGSPRTLFFRGASKKYAGSPKEEAERPLYYCIDKVKRELVFSSIWMYLLALRKDCDTYAMHTNELLEFNGTKLITIKKYSREKAQQNKIVTVFTYPEYSSKKSKVGKWDRYFEDDAEAIYDDYVSIDLVSNLVTFRGKKAQGRYSINDYGRVNSKLSKSYDIWFFEGVPLKNKSCFNFLKDLRKESKLTDLEFFNRFENVIRYLSIDGLYRVNSLMYKATGPTTSELFTGIWHPLTSISSRSFTNGVSTGIVYQDSNRISLSTLTSKKIDINFKTIKEECKSLMS